MGNNNTTAPPVFAANNQPVMMPVSQFEQQIETIEAGEMESAPDVQRPSRRHHHKHKGKHCESCGNNYNFKHAR